MNRSYDDKVQDIWESSYLDTPQQPSEKAK